MVDDSLRNEIADLEIRLAELKRERASVLSALEQLKLRHTMPPKPTSQVASIAASRMALSNAEKVAL